MYVSPSFVGTGNHATRRRQRNGHGYGGQQGQQSSRRSEARVSKPYRFPAPMEGVVGKQFVLEFEPQVSVAANLPPCARA